MMSYYSEGYNKSLFSCSVSVLYTQSTRDHGTLWLVIDTLVKVTEGVSGQQGVSGHGPSFRSLGAVFANNCTALESSKVGYACALTTIWKNC